LHNLKVIVIVRKNFHQNTIWYV